MELIVSPAAVKQLADRKLAPEDRARLLAKLGAFAANPFARHAWAKPLAGRSEVVRVRQGNFRAVCRIDRTANQVVVDAVLPRKEVYRR